MHLGVSLRSRSQVVSVAVNVCVSSRPKGMGEIELLSNRGRFLQLLPNAYR